MGQHAEDILDGSCCQLCGQYFEDNDGNLYSHGKPVVCEDCWKELSSQERSSLTKAHARVLSDSEEVNVDLNFLEDLGLDLSQTAEAEYKVLPESLPEPFEIMYNGKACKVQLVGKQESSVFEVATKSYTELFFKEADGRWTDIQHKTTKQAKEIGALIDQYLSGNKI